MSQAFFEGNCTKEPDLRWTPSSKAVCDFSVAVNRKWTDSGGVEQEEVSFFECTAWGSLAENISESLHKGDRVVVVARMRQDTWSDDHGNKRSQVKFTVDMCGPSLRFAKATVERNTQRPPAQGQTTRRPTETVPGPFDDSEEF